MAALPASSLVAASVLCLVGLTWAPGHDAAVEAVVSDLWIVPDSSSPGADSPLAKAIAVLHDNRPEEALPQFDVLASDPVLGGYARLYAGRAHLALEQPAEAARIATAVLETDPTDQLAEAARWLAVEAAEAAEDWDAAVQTLQVLTMSPHVADPAQSWLRLGMAARERGDRTIAVQAFERVRYDYSLTAEAREASKQLDALFGASRRVTRDGFARELARANRFFEAGRYGDAKIAFRAVRSLGTGDDADLIELRLAVCDYFLGRVSAAKTALNDYVHDNDSPARVPEARFYFLSAQRRLRQFDDFVDRVADFVEMYPDSPFAPRALDELGTHYILQDDDAKAAAAFADLYRLYPRTSYAARAAWKSGWWDYKTGDYAGAIRTFESAFETFGTSNYRPSWVYWAARAHRRLGDRANADAGFQRVVSYYRNSYYGREALRELASLTGSSPVVLSPPSAELPATFTPGRQPANREFIRTLLAEGLYEDAIRELRRSQREGGTSPAIEATIAFALAQEGERRPSINAMRRAYPGFMAAGGEALPIGILRTIFPVGHWDLIEKYSAAHELDPFLMTALIAQESTFQADVRSSANAWGLMQIIPGTGRVVAQKLGIRPFRTSRLTEPETNVRIGMKYFADLLDEFGEAAPSLASYNAGEHRVRAWLAERPDLTSDEFVDDIPFPETQNYVKRIVGTTEDYRLLYGHLSISTGVERPGR